MKIELKPFDLNSVESALRQVKSYQDSLPERVERFCKELANIGMKVVKQRMQAVPYDGDNDMTVTIERTATGYRIVARGESVAFIEFGAGVHYNGEEGYYLDRPLGIVDIGEYGKGYGKRDKWYYYPEGDKSQPAVATHGNPPANAFFYAETEIAWMISQVARKVFTE